MCRGISRANLEGNNFTSDFNNVKSSYEPFNYFDYDGFDNNSWNNFSFPTFENDLVEQPKDIIKTEIQHVAVVPEKKEMRKTSYDIFMSHYNKGGAAAVVDYPCYEEWVNSRSKKYKKESEGFRKSLTSHLTKTCGRQPFAPEVEEAILKIIRQKKPWPVASKLGITLGSNGFRTKGYHESLRCNQQLQNAESNKRPAPIVKEEEPVQKRVCYEQQQERFSDPGSTPPHSPYDEDFYLDAVLKDLGDNSNVVDDQALDIFMSNCLSEFGQVDSWN